MITRFFLTLSLVVFLSGEALAADKKIVLNTGVRNPFTTAEHNGFLDELYKEVFRRIGYDATVSIYEASARSLKVANDGVDDGVALRIKGLEKKFPNLIRVPEKVMDNDFVAYSFGLNQEIKGWNSLDNNSIAYIIGWQIFNNNLGHHKDVIRTKDADQLFSLFKGNRVDYILYERWQGLWRAQQLGLKVSVHEPPLAKREMFMYLHKKHAGLVDKAAAALADMKRDGTYQKIVDRTLTPLLPGN